MSEPKLIGDAIEEALQKVHADKLAKLIERATKKPCKCNERRERLNALHKNVQEIRDRVLLNHANNTTK